MKKKAVVKTFQKTPSQASKKFSAKSGSLPAGRHGSFGGKKLKKEGEEKKPWFNEDEDWKKDGLEEPEEKKSSAEDTAPNKDSEDDWIEKDKEPDGEDSKIIEEDFPEEEDKDNY